MEKHNGQIRVESKAGEASTFPFTLPVSASSGQEQRKLVQVSKPDYLGGK